MRVGQPVDELVMGGAKAWSLKFVGCLVASSDDG